ncbi:DNA primase [Litorimonas taeanensis]|uniref:DNA primase n=1 Tax=Litorimonas taeanensis TaxID=568099 RepID=A0A420WI96_9PROT|nr:DNA primase [Litorimonas taeanensis]RKQ70713.1 DNA primase [Litorimonas taeanensis]
MKFGEAFLDEIKARVRPSDVVGRHVKLKRQGREFAGLSPFTSEKTPSFFVNDEKGFYHCFSSGKHGDAISFLMEVEGLSFPEAVEKLADMAGIEMPKADPQAEARAARNKETISWMERAQEFFERSLYRQVGETARDYLTNRGLSKTAAQYFGMGFAPNDFSALKSELIQQGASEKQLVEAGLIIESDDRSRDSWDRFRDRIMFPIHDSRGRLVAFGGRAMDKDAKAKYLNSPETPVFSKSKLLYNYHRARKALSNPKNGSRGMIVAEGYMDVIALSRAGFEHAVAPMGTALTEEQIDLLWRAGPEPILCFDGDKAGLRAAYRSIERALPLLKPGQSLRFALLPEGKDPDDLIRAEGPPAMKAVLESAIPLIDMLWRREQEKEPLQTPEQKAGLKSRLYAALGEIEHEDVKALYKTELLSRFDAAYGWQASRRTNRKQEAKADKLSMKRDAAALARNQRRERALIGAILLFPELLLRVDETLFELPLSNPDCMRLRRSFLSYWRVTKAVEISALNTHISNEGLEGLSKELLRDRLLITAAMGGSTSDLDTRTALWQEEANALIEQNQTSDETHGTRLRMADTIREDNSEALRRLMRAAKADRD